MIRTVKIEVNAANPQLPLTPAEVFEDSAVTFIIIGVPRAHGKQTITGVSVGVINPDGQATAIEAVRDGSAWVATVHAADIGGSGTVKNGILISASGKDENDSPVEAWILGAGDLVVMQHDGTIKPGERLNRVDWFETAPESPKIGNLAPLDGIIKIYTSTGWTSFVGFVTIDWDNVTNKPTEFPPESGKLPLKSLPKYLHALAFDDTYPTDAAAFYATIGGSRVLGGCSIVRKSGLVGGNFDYPYDESASFAVKVSAAQGRHASVGMAYVGTRLAENAVASGVYSPLYRVLPGMTESGINGAGVYAKINVIPRDPTKDPAPGGTRDLHALAVVRHVLDNFDNAADAATYIAAHYYIPETSADSYHWVIADAHETYIIEDGAAHNTVTTSNLPLTNFRAYSRTEPYGTGHERETILAASSTVESAVLSVRFTSAYAEGWPWPDEFAGQEDAEGKIPYTATDRLRAWANEHVAPLLDANRKPASRGNGCWQTVYSTIYDFAAKTMKVAVQEQDEWFTFAVDANGVTEVAWEDVKDKPTAFPPTAHAASHALGALDPITIAQGQVNGLVSALEGKLDKSGGTGSSIGWDQYGDLNVNPAAYVQLSSDKLLMTDVSRTLRTELNTIYDSAQSKVGSFAAVGGVTPTVSGGVADVSALFSGDNSALMTAIENKVDSMFDNGETEEF